MESRFYGSPRETKIGSQNRIGREIGDKLKCSTKKRKTTFGSSSREVRKNGDSRNRDSTVERGGFVIASNAVLIASVER